MKTLNKLDTADAEAFVSPTLIQIGAVWCAPCKALRPVVAKVSLDNPDLTVYYVDIENVDVNLVGQLDLQTIPKLFLVHDGDWVEISGRTAQAITEEVDGIIL